MIGLPFAACYALEINICLYDNSTSSESQIEFDPVKDAKNLAKHGVSQGDAQDFDWGTAKVVEDSRPIYTEKRFKAFGFVAARLHVLVFCLRADKTRVISIRRANDREFDDYVDKT